MIGTLDPSVRDVTVVGGGFAGLVSAYYLDRAGWRVTLHEAESRAGGLIRTNRTPRGIAESAAHSFLATHAIRELCDDLGVELLPVRNNARYIWREGKLRRQPLRFLEVLVLLSRALFVPSNGSRSLEEWARRHLGEAAAKYLVTPMVRGIYGAEPSEVAVAAAFPRLRIPRGLSVAAFLSVKMIGFPRSRPRPRMMAPREGMGAVIEALRSRLKSRLGDRFRESSRISEIPTDGNTILCVPALEASQLLQSISPDLATALRKIRYSPLLSATVFARPERTTQGVGVLMPANASSKVLGVLFNSSAFDARVTAESESYTAMLGGTSWPGALELSNGELRDLLTNEFMLIFGAGTEIDDIRIHRWKSAVPVYNEDLAEALSIATRSWCAAPGRILFGNYAGQVSLRGMVEAARHLAGALHPQRLDEPAHGTQFTAAGR